MLGLLLDTELSSTQRDYAQTAQACGKALIALINEVLDRAKIEAGKLELEAVPFDLRSILDDVLSLFSEKSRQKGVEVCHIVVDLAWWLEDHISLSKLHNIIIIFPFSSVNLHGSLFLVLSFWV